MKIIYCIGALNKPGGAERVLVNKANYFAEVYGYEVHILIANQNGKPICYEISEKVKLHDMKITVYLSKKRIPIVSFFKNVKKLKKLYKEKIAQINPSIIFVLERGYDDFIIPTILPSIPKVRESHSSMEAVKIMDNYGSRNAKQRIINTVFTWLYKRQMIKYNHVVVLTERDKKFRSYLKNVSVIPNIVSKFDSFPSELLNSKVISVGRLDKFKNFKDQIIVWSTIVKKHPDWRLHIYGEGNEKPKLLKLIDSLGLTNNVFLEGTSSNLAEKYQESSIFLFTSMAEGFGLVIVEAMQFGLPVISYNCPCGPSDIIENNKDGILLKVGDLESLEKNILELIENKEKRKCIGENAIFKSKDFLPEIIMIKWNNLIKDLLDAK
ncbi:glycosyltransferase involved in cell wall biosynthesis [Lutibacter oceani]|uniref:Glycosyltransferase involved in cell wall biosynthesis n=1 Tax=Lutibacter oceani TaxID=1853311 RepID=A0A3D9RSZ3_9FLAO|nr:glycosyltransferase family 4 protein [Lutibacter oceani]REE83093.1 glycosyltransferase involved in cell wall biosynthesis [Lutibacter oceani]